MNKEDLKALAEKAKAWGLDVSRQLEMEDEAGYAEVGSLHDDGDFAGVLVIDTANYNAPDEAKKLADYYAAANPAAILELIAQLEDARTQMERQKDEWLSWEAKRRDLEKAADQLEDAQSENRALLATEQNLRERVKELEEGLADATQSLCWLAFGECRNITDRPLMTALQVEQSTRALLEQQK